MEDNKNRRYQDNGCSFVVEVQPSYQSDDAQANKGSTDDVTADVTDQQALVHREEIPEDRSPGTRQFSNLPLPEFPFLPSSTSISASASPRISVALKHSTLSGDQLI